MNAPRFSVRTLALIPLALGAQFALPALHAADAASASVLAPAAPAALGSNARFVPERSGLGHSTWDLGPDAEHPGRHRFATTIHQGPAAQLQLPGKLGEAPLVWTLADGRRVEWHFDGAPIALQEVPDESRGVDGQPLRVEGNNNDDPGTGVIARRDGGGASLRFHLPIDGVHSRIWVDGGLVAEAEGGGMEHAGMERGGLTGRVIVRDLKSGERLLAMSLPAAAGALSFEETSPGHYQFNLKPANSLKPYLGIPPIIDSSITPFGTWGGYQGNLNNSYSCTGVACVAADAGQLSTTHYAGYIEWDVSTIPASATVTGVWLYPIYANYFTGAAQTVTVTDVDNGRALTPMPTPAYDANYYNDFQTMYGGHSAYGSFLVNAVGNYNVELNSQAVMDLNNRLRTPNQFAVGLSAPSNTANDFMRFTPASTQLFVYYSDYTPNQIVFTQVNPGAGYSAFWLYNYGEDKDISGWQVQSVNWVGTVQTYTFPAATTLKRHKGLNVIDSTGPVVADTIYTGGGVFLWAQAGAVPYYVKLSLLRNAAGGGGSADYVCWGTSSPAPPAGAGWNGGCTASTGTFGGTFIRTGDSDTDGPGDWVNDFAGSVAGQALQPGMSGTRRKSDVIINHIYAFSTTYDWISIVNYGPPINLQGWTLDVWSASNSGGLQAYGVHDGLYTFPSTQLATGDVVWLAPGTATFPTYHAIDTWHQNMGASVPAINWTYNPKGGEIVLNDKAGQGRDYVVFGNIRYEQGHLPQELSWVGPFIPITAAQPDVIRDGDLNSLSNDGWMERAASSGWSGAQASIGPNARGALRVQDEIGATRAANGYYSYSATGFGAGDVFTVTQQVGLENFAIQASPVNGPLSGQLVIKKQGAAAIFKSVPVTVNEIGMTVVSSGLISPPLVLDPGTYAAMLYLNGNWYDAELYNDNERITFGTVGGATYEIGTTPTTAFAANFPTYAAHAYLSTIAPAVITSANPPPIGEVAVAYYYAHTSTGGYGATRTWSIISGVLPPGLSMNTAGAVAGTPTMAGLYDVTVQVIDGAGLARTRAETFEVRVPLGVATNFLPSYDNNNAPYGATLTPLGGAPAYGWSCSGLPPGLSCSAAGNISGTVTAGTVNATYSVTVTVTDGYGKVASKVLPLTIYMTPVILTPALPDGYVGVDYGVLRFQAMGGSNAGTPGTWAVWVSSPLPAGLTLTNDALGGYLSGVPSVLTTNQSVWISYTVPGSAVVWKQYFITIRIALVPNYWIRRGLSGGNIRQIYFSPNYATDATVVADAGGSLYISQDGGFFWRPMNLHAQRIYDPLKGQYQTDRFYNVAFAPGFDGRPAGAVHTLVVSASQSGLWRSTNLDVSWARLGFTCHTEFYFAAADAGTGYCGAINAGLGLSVMYKTTGGLTNWVRTGSQDFEHLVQSPTFAADQTFFAFSSGDPNDSTRFGLYRSEDAGVHWQQMRTFNGMSGARSNPILSPNYATDHVLMVMDRNTIGPGNLLLFSSDGGASFNQQSFQYGTLIAAFPPNYDVSANPRIYAGCDPGTGSGASFQLSNDNGVTFAPTGTGGMPPSRFSGYFAVSPDFVADQTVFGFGGASAGLFRSQDAGKSWGPSDSGLYLQSIKSVAFAPNYSGGSGKLFTATDSGIYYSTNGGQVWKGATIPANTSVYALAVSPNFAVDATVYASAYTGNNPAQLRSLDGGLTFAPFGTVNGTAFDPDDLKISPNFATDQTLFLSGIYNTLSSKFEFQKSTNGGSTYAAQAGATLATPGRFGVSPGFATDQTVYLDDNAYPTALARISVNGGVSFGTLAAATAGPDAPAFPAVYNRASGTNGTASHTFFWNCKKTTDAGASFTSLSTYACGGKLRVSPNYGADGTFFSYHQDYTGATANGLYKFTGGGVSSVQVAPAGNPAAFDSVNQFALSPAYGGDQTLMVGTDAGLYLSTDGGATFALSTGTNPFSSQISAVAQDPNTSGRLYIGSLDLGIVKSDDDGITTAPINTGLPAGPVKALIALGNPTVLLAGVSPVTGSKGIYRSMNLGASWGLVALCDTQHFELQGATLYAACADRASWMTTNTGASWTAMGGAVTDGASISYSGLTGPTSLMPSAPTAKGPGVSLVQAGNPASLWSASANTGAFYSLNGGGTWLAAPGSNDYALPSTTGWSVVQGLGINTNTSGREVIIGNNNGLATSDPQKGVFLSRDGGVTWRNVSGAGSGLEATSKNVSSVLAATTSFGNTDVLVGVNGSTNGGVYLSGDAGEHWTQVNQGFDPSNLSISSLVKTSCGGCPVQYYSGSYGGGMYTRTITVSAPPFNATAASWCVGAACTCGTAPVSLFMDGNQSFKICGGNFQNGLTVEFDGVPATGCVVNLALSPQTIVCNSPAHSPGASLTRVRNPDTRTGYLPLSPTPAFSFSGYAVPNGRVMNTLRVAKVGADAQLTWSCGGCSASAPAWIYRNQNATFTSFLEQYNGGTGTTYTNAGALTSHTAANDAYFWRVE